MLIERKIFQKESYQKDLDSLLENIDNLKYEISNCEMFEKEIDKKLVVLSQAREFLSQAHQNVSLRFVEPVNQEMNLIIDNFHLQGRRFIVDTNFEIKQMTDKGVKELDYSSQGIKDILSFCMRVFLVGQIYKDEKPFIVLDDTFVNLDDENINKAREILNKLSKEYQIIYCYCNERCKIKNPN